MGDPVDSTLDHLMTTYFSYKIMIAFVLISWTFLFIKEPKDKDIITRYLRLK